ncbi:non-ribosomal peptide synthetase [Amycolatopsis sp. WQ 127309]|uniref:non-ribosomal peptide synthetase n=1 Tax=Amycolatopsis sp. WQ 127309 TaxID=2932773 RepID=UPI001FF13205|nr:non-ribosomal peptide synthetase [Amycolatopsis sp. WQ 127309]UOZ05562.1 amino acid adenylation domain-containing protein [Amycolatopsis sp. WQ 127309]
MPVNLSTLLSKQPSHSTAVVAGDRILTYGELDDRCELLARELDRRHVDAGEAIVVSCDERENALITLITCLKKGLNHVPLDPMAPAGVNAEICRDIGARLIVRDDEHGALKLDELPEPAPPPHNSPGTGDIAYTVHTSGTTGTPKGVRISRTALAAHLSSIRERFGVVPGDRVLWFAAPHVDVSIEQALLPLSVGAAVVLRDATPPGFADLAAQLARHQVTVANLPAGYWNAFALALRPGDVAACSGLRVMISGSERMSPRSVRVWQEKLPHVPLLNAYGPTECTITTTTYRVPDAFPEDATEVPIGSACGERSLHVVDEHLRRVPDGEPGELCVGGPLLADGYHGAPEATGTAFVPDPFSGTGHARMYRTGDLVRRSPAGDLVFLGRIDDQLKIRGFRVEPARTAHVLERHPAVRSCAVLGRATPGGGVALVAHVVAPECDAAELLAYAQKKLPPPQVPRIHLLDALPLTADGKLDRSALPPLVHEPSPATPGELTATEAQLAAVWREVLDVEHVGPGDNFFTLGGDSLGALTTIARLTEKYGADVPAQAVFSAATLADLAAELDQVSPPAAGPVPEARTPDRKHLLSSGQESLWFLDRWAPDSPVYNVPWCFHLRGPVDPAVLEESLNAVVRRHAPLRTVFPDSWGEPRRSELPELRVALDQHDLREAPGDAAAGIIRSAARAPFDLARGPLVRTALLRRGDEESDLLVVVHHIVWDELSLAVFEAELAEFYAAGTGGRTPEPPPLSRRYQDFIELRADKAETAAFHDDVAYWRRRLTGPAPAPDLGPDLRHPADQSYRGDTVAFVVDAGTTRRVRALARAEGVTTFLVLATACAVVLGERARREDLVIGTPVTGRPAGFDGLIGYFVNLIALRFDLSGNPGFRTLLQRVRATVLPDFGHQDVPFDVVERAVQNHEGNREPLVRIAFEMHTHEHRDIRLGPVTGTRELVPTGTAKFDLGWQVTDHGDELDGVVEFSSDLFDRDAARAVVDDWTSLLGRVTAPRDAAPRADTRRDTMTAPARDAGTDRWNDTAADFPRNTTLHELVRAALRREPETVAVVAGDRVLTRGALDSATDDLARRLREHGVTPGTVVGVLARRSPELVVALLAVLKAGGAYVPLDPEYPPDRISMMVTDVDAPVVLCQKAFADLVPAGVTALSLDDAPHGEPGGEPFAAAGPLDPAYVIFTSGSTGRPKAVVTQHRAICNRLNWMQRRFRLGPDDVVLQKTSAGFDVSVWEFFWPLLTGAKLVLARPGGHRDPAYLRDVVVEHGVTTVHFVPSMLAAFLDQEDLRECRSLRRTICSGEALPPALVNDFLARVPGELHNLYGPTESAIDVSAWECRPLPGDARATPIGRPIDNVQLHVLGADGHPVPIGTEGELHIGGAGLALGYLGQPALTADRFVPDPFSRSGGRLYRTGDIVRHRDDGELEFVGRHDDQVKIRGQRVELGEIEAVLERHPRVARAAATVHDHRVRAHVVLTPGPAPADEELSTHVRRVLPDHMVPTRWSVLDALPLTTNGKVDRAALRAGPATAAAVPAPESDHAVEDVLAGIWSLVLDLPELGHEQDLFASGAHSLNTLRARARITFALHTELPIRTYFESRTISQQARRLREQAGPASVIDERARAIRALPAMDEADWVRAVAEITTEVG